MDKTLKRNLPHAIAENTRFPWSFFLDFGKKKYWGKTPRRVPNEEKGKWNTKK
jgi:hypothetical protein